MTQPHGERRRAREQALQVLCLLDTQPDLAPEQALELYRGHLLDEAGEAQVLGLTGELVAGVYRDRADLDALISQSSKNWRLSRMNWVDRNILRLCAFELRSARVPAKVAVNEAIELAKRFGTSESSAFVNGVLDRVMAGLASKSTGSAAEGT